MNAGVRMSPRGVLITPLRAAPSVAEMVKEKRGIDGAPYPLAPSGASRYVVAATS
jgi:hypothetical protein